MYSDFECPFCARLAPALDALVARRAADVRVQFRHFPLAMHARARLAHVAAEYAATKGRFWEFHDRLFTNRRALDRASLLAHAAAVGIDQAAMSAALDDRSLDAAVDADIKDGEARGITATPSLLVNGKLQAGALSVEQLERLVEEALGRPAAPSAPENTATDPKRVLGEADARLTVDWFVDLASPLAGRSLSLADRLLARYPRDLRVVFRHRPSGAYGDASGLHASVEQATDREAFWAAIRHAAASRSFRPLVTAEVSNERGALPPAIAADVARAERLNIMGAPAFVIGDRRFDGLPSLALLSAAVDAALGHR